MKGTSFPLSYAQERLWFLDRLLSGNPLYNLNCDWRFTYPVDVDILQQSLNEMVRRHESLRTTFSLVDGEPIQIVAASLQLTLPVVDLRELLDTEREAEALRLATEEAQRPFDLEQGPLVRTTLLRIRDEEYIFLLTMHHIISDGWSLILFWDEFLAIWTAFDNGEPSPLSDLPIQYADFAVWQRNYLTGKVLETQLNYWKKQLANLSGTSTTHRSSQAPGPDSSWCNSPSGSLPLAVGSASDTKPTGRRHSFHDSPGRLSNVALPVL